MSRKVLETNRLVLEELSNEHFEDLYALLSNEKVHTFFPNTLDRKGSEEFLDKIRRRYEADGYSFWAVVRKEDGRFIGICGLLKQVVDGKEETEVGYRITDDLWGMGYGTEAAKGCMLYARDALGKDSVISLIVEENVQSIRVAEKNGLLFEREVMFQDFPHRLYRKEF